MFDACSTEPLKVEPPLLGAQAKGMFHFACTVSRHTQLVVVERLLRERLFYKAYSDTAKLPGPRSLRLWSHGHVGIVGGARANGHHLRIFGRDIVEDCPSTKI